MGAKGIGRVKGLVGSLEPSAQEKLEQDNTARNSTWSRYAVLISFIKIHYRLWRWILFIITAFIHVLSVN